MAESDVTQIIQLMNLYGFAVDSQQWDLFDRIFAANVEADFSEGAHWHDRASFKRDFATFHAPFDSTQHQMTTHLVMVTGDTAHAWCNGSWRLVRKTTDGNPLWDGTGWYDDQLVRTAEGWRIAKRVCRVSWWVGNPAVNETIPGVKFDLATKVLRREGEAGQLGYLTAIT